MTWKYMILLFLTIHSHGYDINETSIDKIGTIYLKHVSSSRTFCGHRTIEYKINIGNIRLAQIEIRDTIKIMTKICDEIKFNSVCHLTIREITYYLTTLESRYKLIEWIDNREMPKTRKKRNNEHTYEMLQRIVQLTDNGYSDLKRNLDELGTIINSLEKFQNRMVNYVDYLNFNSIFQLITLNIEKFINLCNNIIEVTIYKNHKKLIELIRINLLKEELRQLLISSNKENCEIHNYSRMTDLAKLLELSNINARINESQLIISIDIPTVHKSPYNLMQAVPIPFSMSGQTLSQRSTSPYYLMHQNHWQNKTYVLPLSIEERVNCSKALNYLICYPKNTIQIINSADERKIKQLLFPNDPHDSPPAYYDSNIKRLPHLNQLIQLSDTESYLYIVKATTVHFRCRHKNQRHYIRESIMISNLTKDCNVNFEGGFILSNEKIHFKTISHSLDTSNIYSNSDLALIEKETSKKNYNNEMRNLQHEFGNLHRELVQAMHKPKSSIIIPKYSMKEIFIYTTIAVGFIITWAAIFYSNHRTQKQIKTAESLYKKKEEDTLGNLIKQELNCSFKFEDQKLPPKTSRHVRFPSGSYDVPKALTDKNVTSIIQIERPDDDIEVFNLSKLPPPPPVLYATISKSIDSNKFVSKL